MPAPSRFRASVLGVICAVCIAASGCGDDSGSDETSSSPSKASSEASTDVADPSVEPDPVDPLGELTGWEIVTMTDSDDGYVYEFTVETHAVEDYVAGGVIDDVCGGVDPSTADQYDVIKSQAIRVTVNNATEGGFDPGQGPRIDFLPGSAGGLTNGEMNWCKEGDDQYMADLEFGVTETFVVVWFGKRTPNYPDGEFTTSLWGDYNLVLQPPGSAMGVTCEADGTSIPAEEDDPCYLIPSPV